MPCLKEASPGYIHKGGTETDLGLTVHTIGYQLRTIDELIHELKSAGVDVLVDVRQTPWSNRRDFAKFRLEPALHAEGLEYVHAKFAGNPKELRRAASSHAECLSAYANYLSNNPRIVDELWELITDHQAAGRRISLFCYERHPDDCHRSILTAALRQNAQMDIHVAHIATDGAPRLTQTD